MVQFTDEPVRTRRGRVPVPIEPEVAQWCDATYARGTAAEFPADLDSPDTASLLRQIRLYATRQGKSVDLEFFEADGQRWARFRMRDRQKYNIPAKEK